MNKAIVFSSLAVLIVLLPIYLTGYHGARSFEKESSKILPSQSLVVNNAKRLIGKTTDWTPIMTSTLDSNLPQYYGCPIVFLSVPQGTDITLSLDGKFPYNGAGYSYRWTVFGTNIPVGTDNTFVIQTTGLTVQDNHRIFCDVTKDGKMQRVIAFFDVKEKPADASDSTSEPSTAQSIKPDPAETWSKQEDAALEAAFRVSPSLTVPKGDDINLSLDAPYNSSDYSHRWTVFGTSLPVGMDNTYTIKTGSLEAEQKYRVFCDVTRDGKMQRVIAFFELDQEDLNSEEGDINIVLKDAITQETLPNTRYTLVFENTDTPWSHESESDENGAIKIDSIPIGTYTIVFDDPELTIDAQYQY